jgi:hypothetical protein
MTQPSHTLRQILVKAAENSRRGHPSLAVFDLDSTLFDVGPRLERILMDFAQVPDHIRRFPEQVKHFVNLKVEKKDWGVKDALIRAGLDGHHPEFQAAVRDFWKTTFFSNDYLRFDRPYPGAVEYVQALEKAGAVISYLTGRDVARMGQGSEDVLKHWQFPLGEKATLDLKPTKEMDDAAFKTDWFLALPKDHYKDIWFFENEPVNINKMRIEAAHVEIVFFDSTHSRREELTEDLPRIMHFLLEGDE